ncbi:hypothetical protein TBLA_0E04780 [Henningerozyma blattae CBS 6284]|uniref:ATP synthase subunit J, mitochondrial n=1 Tax=Henningerozyma blattae (strain ATCC 34711 / CBS 6284 / DSM 70876 / NBRC 10599 / NRRL Y-10934 / UCD 77-7) TaxID=1071380 RepID=I2H578_HENB6|nr:hypothetical protein TBLA_0E04780 [Tetrapisispora blattae CBS 6284]CCH61530.1 hypothetical protein TBLA_0E04780 [Tetrapisispora blattae CBS 6284]
MISRFSFPIVKHYWPVFVSATAMYYVVGKAADAYSQTDEYINDPRNPRFLRGEKWLI